MTSELNQTLQACQNPDQAIRQQAEERLRTAETQNLPEFLFSLSQELAGKTR